MKEQNFKNHSRFVTGYHVVSTLLLFLLLIGSIVNLVTSNHDNRYSASLLVLSTIVLVLIGFYTRTFALIAQDRAIKAEENLRHYLLTGKTLDAKLKVRQIIGLRFASDEEFPALVEKALKEKLSEKDIKKSIINWRPDYYRV
jgi:hypothetical protein